MFAADAVRCMRKQSATGGSGATDWRVVINSGQSSKFPAQFSIIEFREPIGGPSASTGGVASASSSYSINPASYAFDGNINTLWSPDTYPALPLWIAYSHPVAVDISEVFLKVPTTSRSPLEIQIEKSSDGESWEHVATFNVDPPMSTPGSSRSFVL